MVNTYLLAFGAFLPTGADTSPTVAGLRDLLAPGPTPALLPTPPALPRVFRDATDDARPELFQHSRIHDAARKAETRSQVDGFCPEAYVPDIRQPVEKVLMAKLLSLVALAVLAMPVEAQSQTYVKGDTVRLAVQSPADALPDSTVIAVPGDRVQTRRSEILVNGQPVTLSDNQRQQFVTVTDEVVPERHYVVVGERRDGPYSVVTYYGLIPATKIVQKLN